MSNTTNNQTHDRKKQPSDEKKASLTLNFVMNATLTMSQFLFPLITFPYISRILLPTGTGKVSFATSVVSYFALFAQLGIPTYGIRACAKVRDDRKALERTVQELFLINLIMSILAYIVLFLAIAFVPRMRQEKALFLIVVSSKIELSIILLSQILEFLIREVPFISEFPCIVLVFIIESSVT